MRHVLIVHESESIRVDLAREFLAEGFTVAEADSALAAVREIWQGSFVAVVIGERLPGMNGTSLEEQVRGLAPEVVTLPVGREPPARLVRKVADILDGAVAA